MQFPSDHYWHVHAPAEWMYFWGKLSNDKFFHFAEFLVKLGGARINFRHWSLDGQFGEEVDEWDGQFKSHSGFYRDRYSFYSPKFGLTLFPKSKPIDHSTEEFNYYSITNLEGEGHIYPDKKVQAEGWLDHHWVDYDSKLEKKWDWMGIRLDCGVSIICGYTESIRYCHLDYCGHIIDSPFMVKEPYLLIRNLGMKLTLTPLKKEVIFKPTIGPNYSEQPFNVAVKGNLIGYGMRERTYIGEEDANQS